MLDLGGLLELLLVHPEEALSRSPHVLTVTEWHESKNGQQVHLVSG